MKLLKIMGHPVTVMIMFLLIIISGEHFGGFYLLYILLGLPYGVPQAIIALAGLLAMFLGYKLHSVRWPFLKPALLFIGICMMVLALFTLFDSSKGYNDDTSNQAVPLITLCLFGLFSICCLFLSAYKAVKGKRKDIELA